MADPIGRAADRARGRRAVSRPRCSSRSCSSVIGTMPMSTLANFGGMSLDHDALDRISAEWQSQRSIA